MEEMKTLQTRFWTDFHPADQKTDKIPTKENSRPREPRPPGFLRYASQNAPRSRIIDKALQTDLILPPCKTLNPPNAA